MENRLPVGAALAVEAPPRAKKNRGGEITSIRLRPKFALCSAVNTAGKGFQKHGL